MSEFKVIETQEQLNEVIGERIRRAEEKAAEKYSDYETLKQQNADFATQITQLQEQLKKQADTISTHQSEVDGLKAQVQNYETSSVKTKVALESGLPYQMASRLSGTTEEEIRADAQAMVELIGSQRPVAPIGSGEPVITKPEDAAWRKLAASLTND